MAQLFREKKKKKLSPENPKHSCVYSARDPTAPECQDEGASTDLSLPEWEASGAISIGTHNIWIGIKARGIKASCGLVVLAFVITSQSQSYVRMLFRVL